MQNEKKIVQRVARKKCDEKLKKVAGYFRKKNLKRVDNVNRWKHIGFSNFLKIPQIMFEMVPVVVFVGVVNPFEVKKNGVS